MDLPKLVRESPFFDFAYYVANGGRGREPAEALTDYMNRGEAAGLKPSADFDPAFYLAAYQDVAAAGLNGLAHFVEHGARERRYPNRANLRRDALTITEREMFDEAQYGECRDHEEGEALRLDNAEHYLLFGGFAGVWPNADFDSLFYRGVYPDVSATRENPLMHFIRTGQREGRFTNNAALHAALERIKRDFDEGFYLRRARKLTDQDRKNLPRHYLLHGARAGLDPSPEFSTEYYNRRYPDLLAMGAEPFGHYLAYGRKEGRRARPNYRSGLKPGHASYDPLLPTVMVANHEGSRTGAPLVGLALAKAFSETHNVIVYLGRERGLLEPFLECSILVTVGEPDLHTVDAELLLRDLKRQFGLSTILANSVETHAIVKAAAQVDLPCVALVHEFAEYSLPRGKLADVIASCDRAIVPANVVLESAQKEVIAHYGGRASNIVVRPQGRLVSEDEAAESDLTVDEILKVVAVGGVRPKIVLGAGYVQTRKGVDLFVHTAREVARQTDARICFVWVGDGYDPDFDLGTSIWLRELIDRAGLADRVFLFPAQSKLDAFFEVADVFYLSSLLDPYPNVGVDAIALGKPLVCFRHATGLADPIEGGQVVGAVVDYCDTVQAASAIIAQLEKPADPQANAAFSAQAFDFAAYADFLRGELARATGERASLLAARDVIQGQRVFDPDFYLGVANNVTPESSLLGYVSQAAKGLASANPRPGFNDGAWRTTHAGAPGRVPLEEAARQMGVDAKTHDCRLLVGLRNGKVPHGGVALHIHMHYPELAAAFVERLKDGRTPIDLIITTTSREKQIQIQAAMLNYRRGKVDVLVGPNRGRDIGPFMTAVGDLVLSGGYGVVGHLHGKKSLAVSGGMGDRWRTYLLDTLLGSPAEVAQILDMFAQDPKLGLVFAEDRHAISWSANRELAEDLAKKLSPRPTLPNFPIFPIGNMFWARPAAMAPLWEAKFTWDDFPPEPVPFDGTILHAVERMLPAICEATDHSWRTVFKRGTGW